MLAALATLLVCQLAGEVIVRALSLPLPGPVLGMALLFVPAGVGVVQNLSTLGHEGLGLILVVVLATMITLAVTALTFEYLARWLSVDEVAADHHETGETEADKA